MGCHHTFSAYALGRSRGSCARTWDQGPGAGRPSTSITILHRPSHAIAAERHAGPSRGLRFGSSLTLAYVLRRPSQLRAVRCTLTRMGKRGVLASVCLDSPGAALGGRWDARDLPRRRRVGAFLESASPHPLACRAAHSAAVPAALAAQSLRPRPSASAAPAAPSSGCAAARVDGARAPTDASTGAD